MGEVRGSEVPRLSRLVLLTVIVWHTNTLLLRELVTWCKGLEFWFASWC